MPQPRNDHLPRAGTSVRGQKRAGPTPWGSGQAAWAGPTGAAAPQSARRAFQGAGPPGESRPASGTVGWGLSRPVCCAAGPPKLPGPFSTSSPNCCDSFDSGGQEGSRSHHHPLSTNREAETPREKSSLRRHSSSHARVPPDCADGRGPGQRRRQGTGSQREGVGARASPERPV